MRRAVIALLVLNAAIIAAWLLYPRHHDTPSPTRPSAPAPAPEALPPSPPQPQPPPLPAIARDASSAAPTPAPAPASARETILHTRWGSGPDEFGLRRDPESNPEAPMALVARGRDDVWVLDQVNHRLRHVRAGRPDRDVPLPTASVQDLATTRDGRVITLDRLGARSVTAYGPDGAQLSSISLEGPGIPEGGGVTGVFADADGSVYAEREHGTLVRLLDPQGQPDPGRSTLEGRPSRDGRLLLSAAITDRRNGVITVRALARETRVPAWESAVALPDAVLHVLMLDSDAAGRVYLAAAVGHESAAPPYALTAERWLCARLAPDGSPAGQIELQTPDTADETFRPLAVDDDGALYQLLPGRDGLDVIRYTFP